MSFEKSSQDKSSGRPKALPVGKTKLQENLPPGLIEEVDRLLSLQRRSDYQVAKAIQKWGYLTDRSIQSVMGQVAVYRKHYHSNVQIETLTVVDPATGQKQVTVKEVQVIPNRLKGRIDSYRAQEDMITMQMARINKLYEREQKMPTLMDQMRRELELLMRMLTGFSDFQFELGILHRVARTVEHHSTLNNPDLLGEEEKVAAKIHAIKGREQIMSRVQNVLNLVSTFDEGKQEIIEQEVKQLEGM